MLIKKKGPTSPRQMLELQVDERCLRRCTELAAALTTCNDFSGGKECLEPLQKFREHCVQNSACNPSGRMQDPAKQAKKCAALAKRVARCEMSINGENEPSKTADCEQQRSCWRQSCSNVASYGALEQATVVDSSALTRKYRGDSVSAEKQFEAAALTDLDSNGFVAWLADSLVRPDGEARWVALGAIYWHPICAMCGIVGAACGVAWAREANIVARSGTNTVSAAAASSAQTQRLLRMRVIGQATVVAAVASVMGLVQVIDYGLSRSHARRHLSLKAKAAR